MCEYCKPQTFWETPAPKSDASNYELLKRVETLEKRVSKLLSENNRIKEDIQRLKLL